MAEIIKKHDFVELEYTGKLKDSGMIFDTTDEGIAKKENIYNKNMIYGALVICVGEAQILKGLDEQLEGKEIGKQITVDISPEQGFGKKDASLLKLVPMTLFKKQDIMPMPGLQVNIDGAIGTIRTVTGGRIIVDFNHPLSGKYLIYEVKVNKKIIIKNNN